MRTCVVHPNLVNAGKSRDPDDAIAEAISLVDALGVNVVETQVVNLSKLDAGMFLGSGKVKDFKERWKSLDVGLVVINFALSPIQQRNLERAWHVKVLDRTALILEIFGERARTKEGVLQVNLAHLTYQRSRLVRSWTHLERQRGGGGFMGGPGETQIESDRRDIDNAIVRLKRQLEKVVKTRELHRASRNKVPFPIVALVGYTNAGKSTIFNRLTGASVLQKDMVFATLDPTMRAIELPSGKKAILSDTVGFISDLPTQLVAAFRATLEEVLDADLLLHVRDISHRETEFQAQNVKAVLSELGIGEDALASSIEVWNKSDRLNDTAHSNLRNQCLRMERTVLSSARDDEGLDDLVAEIEAALEGETILETRDVPNSNGRLRAWLYENSLVVAEEQHEEFGRLTLKWTDVERKKFEAMVKSSSNS